MALNIQESDHRHPKKQFTEIISFMRKKGLTFFPF